ncbi:MAG: CarD family transcriptional regulator, partial [Terriglobales bacterium]
MILPFVRQLFADVEKSSTLARALPHLREGAERISVTGLTPTAKALVLALLARAARRPLLCLVASNRAAEDLFPVVRALGELSGAVAPQSVLLLPAFDSLPYHHLSPHPEIQEQRAATLWKMATGAAAIVIAPVTAAAMRLRAAPYYAGLGRSLRRGEPLDAERLVEHLVQVGYQPSDLVEMPGQFAQRGGILDVYSPEADRPVRAELFGDEIESLRKFDPASQRSSTPLDEAVLLPLTETPVRDDVLSAIHARLSGGRIEGAASAVAEAVAARGASVFPGWELYAPLAGSEGTLLDLLPGAAIFLDEPTVVRPEIDNWWEKITLAHQASGVGSLAPPQELFLPPGELEVLLGRCPGGSLEHLEVTAQSQSLHLSFNAQPSTRLHGSIPLLVDEVRKLTGVGQRVVLAAANAGEVQRLADIFTEYGLPYRLGNRAPSGGETYLDESAYFAEDLSTTTIVKSSIPEGLVLPLSNLAVFGYRDLFDESEAVVASPLRRRSKVSVFLSDFRDLAVGDFVVHVDHGIGRYSGLKEIVQGGAAAEFMVLEYAEGARLYVPLTRLDLVQKYRSAEGTQPVLARLGSAAWARTKARVKKAMRDMADELLQLYAQRKVAESHSFAPDTEWQREFEEAFEHNETDDQAQSVADVKRDMETPRPMDRLLCGDVGYGKTEVA